MKAVCTAELCERRGDEAWERADAAWVQWAKADFAKDYAGREKWAAEGKLWSAKASAAWQEADATAILEGDNK